MGENRKQAGMYGNKNKTNAVLVSVLAVLLVAILTVGGYILGTMSVAEKGEEKDPVGAEGEEKDPDGAEGEGVPGGQPESDPDGTEEQDPATTQREEVIVGQPEGDPDGTEEPTQPESRPSPFYGIWCGAYNTQADAQPLQSQLEGYGFLAKTHLTTSWRELNAAPYYVVTAGEYTSLEEAELVLPRVQQICPDAYIKYTGQWQGQ